MLARAEISFVVLWIVNPLVILFYQNCSWSPPQRAEADRGISVSATDRAPACAASGLNSKVCAE